jgi:hypothetical protein
MSAVQPEERSTARVTQNCRRRLPGAKAWDNLLKFVLMRLAQGVRAWLAPIGRSSRRPQTVPVHVPAGPDDAATTLRYPIDVHGVRVRIDSDCPRFMEYVRRDFCFFYDGRSSEDRPHVHVTFLVRTPRWEAIPAGAIPLFTTVSSVVYRQGPRRYVDHDGEVLTVYDLKRDEGTVYSADPLAMYRIAYSLLMTRIGFRLDGARRHRLHALGVSVHDAAWLFLGDGGCGKTTLGLELMKQPQVGWLSDDVLPVDPHGRALAFPTAPRLVEGSPVPWLPPSARLARSPVPRHPPKLQVPSWSMLARVRPAAPVRALFLCRQVPDAAGPSLRRVGVLEALRGLCANGLTGRGFGHLMAYHLQFSPWYVLRTAVLHLSRLWTFGRLAWTVPVYRFEMSRQISDNAALVLRECSGAAAPRPSGRGRGRRAP